MSRIGRTELMCILITTLSPVFTEITKIHATIADPSNSSTTSYVPAYDHEKDDSSQTKFDGLQDVGRKWKSMESWTRKLLSGIYNDSLPFLKHVNDNLDISHTCKQDLRKMLEGIDQNKHWAVQMLDSFGHLPAGIGSGTISSLGDYDLCLDVNVPDSFQGQYCNLDFILPMPERTRYERSKDIQEITRVLQPDGYFALFKEHFNLFYLMNLRSSICVPSTCSTDELQKIATAVAQKMDLSLTLHIPNCEVMQKEVKFDPVEITIMFILGVLLILVLSSTVFEIYLKLTSMQEENAKKKLSLPIKYLLCFSLCTNTKELLKPDTQKDSIKVFHGIRVLKTIYVVLVHFYLFQNFKVAGSLLFVSKQLKKVHAYYFANATIGDQTFFFMSAVLHAFQVMKKKEGINVKKQIFKRMWRLLPPSLLVIACVILIPHLGSGPVWKETVTDELTEKCRAKWWTNLLLINNFLSCKDMCFVWLWFVAAAFQIYVLSFLVLIPMKKNPRLALTITVFVMIGSNAIYAAFHLYYEVQPAAAFDIEDTISKDHISDFADRGHFPIYINLSAACIGLIVGYFLAIGPSKLHISSKISFFLWLASLSTLVVARMGVYKWSGGNLPSAVVSTLYAVGSRILWNAALAWITIACMTGHGGFVSEFFSLPVFVPLGRLSYMILLTHPIFQLMYIGSTRSVIHMEVRTIAHTYLGILFVSFCSAFGLTLLFELPFVELGKLMFAEKTSEKTVISKTLANGNPEDSLSNNGCIIEDSNSDKKID